ncbi:hypothetical protein M9434_001134 [Picochlorum sp. BPE23]|nr:hypothetical protein M9434_001134 [Picochlorum sp. BPE23]
MYAVASQRTFNLRTTVQGASKGGLRRHARKAAFVVRASEEPAPETPKTTESAPEMPQEQAATPPPPPPAPKTPGFGELMAFSGPAPEIINGRLAMIAFVAALGAELSTGESVLTQFKDAPVGVIGTFLLFSAASLIPMFKNADREAVGPLTPQVELTNGRAAMLGFASLLLVEGFRGAALF